MRFGGEVDHQTRAVDGPPGRFGIGDVAFDEVHVDAVQAPSVARVGQTVQHADPPPGALELNGSHEIGADEPGGSGYENGQLRLINAAIFNNGLRARHRWKCRSSGLCANVALKRSLLSCSKPIGGLSSWISRTWELRASFALIAPRTCPVPGSASMSLKAMTNSSKAATMKPEHGSKSANKPYRQATGSTPASRFNSRTRQTWDASVDVAGRKNGARLSAVTGEFGALDPNQPFARSRGPGAHALS